MVKQSRGCLLIEKRFLLLLIFCGLIILFCSVGSADTNVTVCGTLSTPNTIYTQVNDINVTGSTCISITGVNSTFNGNGFKFSNTTWAGTAISIGANNITITNVNISINYSDSGARAIFVSGKQNINIIHSYFQTTWVPIYLTNVNNLTIKNNTFFSVGLYGIYLSNNGTNLLIDNNFIYNLTNYWAYLVTPNNFNVSNNFFNKSYQGVEKPYIFGFDSSNNLSFYNNQFYQVNVTGVIYQTKGNYSKIYNNTLTKESLPYYGLIEIINDGYYNQIYNNNITLNSSLKIGMHGILCRQQYYTKAYNNYIEGANFGMLFHNGSRHSEYYNNTLVNNIIHHYTIDNAINNSFYNNTIIGGFVTGTDYTYGIYIYKYPDRGNSPPMNNTYYDNIIQGNSLLDYAITIINGSSNNFLYNINISGLTSSDYNIYIPDGHNTQNNTFLNVTYDPIGNESIGATSSIIRRWYYQTNVTDSSGNAIPSAIVTIYNASNDYQGSYETDSNGLTIQTNLTDYINNGGTKSYHSPYTMTVSKSGYTSASYTRNITSLTNVYNDSLIISLTSSPTTSPSSGGSSPTTTQTWTTTYVPTTIELQNGLNQKLQVKERVKFLVGVEIHYVGVKSLTTTEATISISSNETIVTLAVGEESKADANNDGYYDIYVKLNSIANNKADINIKTIYEKIPEGKESVTTTLIEESEENLEKEIQQNKYFVWIIAGIVILAVIAVVLSMKQHKRKKRHMMYGY